jgi:hypothetical protein
MSSDLIVSQREFDAAHGRVAVEAILSKLSGAPTDLLPFEEVRQKLRLSSRAYRGRHDVPLDQIIGSVDRDHEFTRSFLPRHDKMRNRWATVDQLTAERGLLPVELYKVSDTYFVIDGHHRISVARQAGANSIEAHVREYQTSVHLTPDTTVEDLLIKAEYREFLDRTGLDKSRPEQRIEFTAPGGYRDLEHRIALYQAALGQIDGEPFSYQDAAAYWYDMIYTAVVQIIQQRDMLQDFPDRTEADLFVWVVNHQQELSEEYGYTVPMTKAGEHVAARHRPRWPRRYLSVLKRRIIGRR